MDIMSFVQNTIILGIVNAAPLILVAMGFTLIYALNGFINVAYGENITMGAILAYTFNSLLGMNFYLAIIPATILTGGLSVITYFLVFRPAINKRVGQLEMIILSVGLSFFIRYAARVVIGVRIRNFEFVEPIYYKLFDVGITSVQIISIILVAVIAIGLYVFIYKTNYGEKVRALADNKEVAMISGINPNKVAIVIWFIAGISGALGGIFFGVFSYISAYIGWDLLLVLIMICIVGGVGSVRGALLVSIAAGLLTTAVTLVTKPLYAEIALLIVFIVFLKARRKRVL